MVHFMAKTMWTHDHHTHDVLFQISAAQLFAQLFEVES